MFRKLTSVSSTHFFEGRYQGHLPQIWPKQNLNVRLLGEVLFAQQQKKKIDSISDKDINIDH